MAFLQYEEELGANQGVSQITPRINACLTANELRQVRGRNDDSGSATIEAGTAEVGGQTVIARQRTEKDAHHYRVEAERFRTLAANTSFSSIQVSRLRIAAIYERLAQLAEASIGSPKLGNARTRERRQPTHNARASRNARIERVSPTRPRQKEAVVSALAGAAGTNAEFARQIARTIELSNEREIASAALVAMSRTLCTISAMLSRNTWEKLRRREAEGSF
jgi:hypothetical protein